MKGHHEITEELKALNASFPESVQKDVFSLPDGYFEQFAATVLDAVRSERLTASFPDELPFALPENYFEQFPGKVRQRLLAVNADDEIFELSPLLAGLKGQMPLEAPVKKYFENNSLIPHARTVQMPVVSAVVHKVKWMRWAAAAAVLCIFSLGGFRFLEIPRSNAVKETSVQAALASIPDAEIQQYLSLNMDAYDIYTLSGSRSSTASEERLLNGISDKEIEKILEDEY